MYKLRTTVDKFMQSPESTVSDKESKKWGVFEAREGLQYPRDRVELRSVHSDEAEAKEEANRLNEDEGYVEHEVHDNLDTVIYDELYFFAGKIALKGTKTITEEVYEEVE